MPSSPEVSGIPVPDDGSPWVVVGLGNPGPEYAGNRHNVGAMVVDLLAERVGGRFRPLRRGRVDVVESRLGGPGGRRVVLGRPRSYMNDSGGAVGAVLGFFDVPPDRLVVVHDELDLPYGTLRVKLAGGDNGHNGLRSVRRSLGTGDFYRVRFGVGRPPGRQDPADFVLRDFSATERKDLPLLVDRTADATESVLLRGLDVTQSEFHRAV